MSETTSFNPSDEYINALLSKVAYEGVSVGDNFLDLNASKFSETERNFLFQNYEVVDSSSDLFSGFKACWIRNKETNEVTYAIAGTDFDLGILFDWGDDYDICKKGMATEQFIEAYNYYMQVANAQGSIINQIVKGKPEQGGYLKIPTSIPGIYDYYTVVETINTHEGNGYSKISGTAYNDTIYGNEGNDTLKGGNGNDTLIGGKGKDSLSGGNGDDTYIWNFGDGVDYIDDRYGNNVVKFGEGITLDNLSFERSNVNDSSNGHDLYIFVNGDRNQGVNLYNFFGSTAYQNFSLKFADGSTFIPKDNGFDFALPDGQITLNGLNHSDILTGNNQDNTIKGKNGNDTLIGGKGNDSLFGGNGDDTYIWNFGDGFDYIDDSYGNNVIKFGEGI